jgi:ankyrin repeat protein
MLIFSCFKHLLKRGLSLEIMGLLLRKDVSVNTASKDGQTSLYIAAQKDQMKVVELLLSNGVSTVVNTASGTLIDMAIKKNSLSLIRTLFYYSVIQGNLRPADLLLRCTVRINVNEPVEGTLTLLHRDWYLRRFIYCPFWS